MHRPFISLLFLYWTLPSVVLFFSSSACVYDSYHFSCSTEAFTRRAVLAGMLQVHPSLNQKYHFTDISSFSHAIFVHLRFLMANMDKLSYIFFYVENMIVNHRWSFLFHEILMGYCYFQIDICFVHSSWSHSFLCIPFYLFQAMHIYIGSVVTGCGTLNLCFKLWRL